jgi:hypothetical protein
MTRYRLYVVTILVGFAVVATACSSSTAGKPAQSSSPAQTASSRPVSAPTTPADATAMFDGSYTGFAYASGEQPSQGEQLTFKVTNGEVDDWQGYMIGECTPVLEDLYIQGPSAIKSGVLTADSKVTPDPANPGAYTNTSVIGTFDGTKATGTVNYIAVGPCVEPPWNWTAVRTPS